jgi:hypothetical protein
MNIKDCKDWELIVAIAHWSKKTDLPKNVTNAAYVAAWKHTDAYGDLGFIPSQGYDWSGFRDSSKESTKRSADAIRKVLKAHGIESFEVIS